MKKIIVLALLLTVIMSGSALAQSTPHVDARQEAQRERITEGIGSGEVTRHEARRLKKEQRHIRKTERKAEADGVVTTRERRKLDHKQDRVSRDIRRQKHDQQDRLH